MPDYQKMYTLLFNAITDALQEIDRHDPAAAQRRLILAQQQAEEIYIETAQ